MQLLAPAKLNLFLHITGRRDDGYHNLQTLFQLLDGGDQLTFTATDSNVISLSPQIDGVAPEDLELIQDPTLDNLNKLAIQYSDAVIHGHDNIAPEITSFINDTNTLSVENKGGDIFINDVAALYEEVLEGKSILVEE